LDWALHPGATAHLDQHFAGSLVVLNGDTAQDFDREVAEIEEEFFQGGTKE